jgi:hypothetical protein
MSTNRLTTATTSKIGSVQIGRIPRNGPISTNERQKFQHYLRRRSYPRSAERAKFVSPKSSSVNHGVTTSLRRSSLVQCYCRSDGIFDRQLRRLCCINLGSLQGGGHLRSRSVVDFQAPSLSRRDHPAVCTRHCHVNSGFDCDRVDGPA